MKRPILVGTIAALTAVAAWANWPTQPLPDGTVADRVLVRKAARTLQLYRGTELLRSYPVSLGRNPAGPKTQQGDGRTPEGTYRLDYRNAASSFHRSLHISYPSTSDIASAKSRGVDPGGLVMVHGMRNHFGWIGRAHRAVDWTDGCVAVTDEEMDEIWRVVPDGTPIEIQP
ncbi:MAG: L,D-transpeptidase family protein [Cyanobacteria bacterium SZAS LIN-2]|nr:L,D-transpeptidase family protein [Cyanobacteria bacterium SZAS LIN-2]